MKVGQVERETQNHVVSMFVNNLGYEYGGNRQDLDNTNVDESALHAYLTKAGYEDDLARRAVQLFITAASLPPGSSLYDVNRTVYDLLRYGVKVKKSVSQNFETVWLIDWAEPSKNDFVIAEEVTIKNERTKRPDIVLYVNGIALGVIELKRSRVGVSEGIRQNLGNQKAEFIRPFFSTIQLLFAGNDVEGLRYGVIETREKYWLAWKEPENSEYRSFGKSPLDSSIIQMCSKERFLELIHDFMVFDSGTKKTARHNQYFGVKAAQERIKNREGGIVWHTQGSGKSLTMVWLARWIRETQLDSRVVIITDRTELDIQIEQVFSGANESITRTSSGSELTSLLGQNQPWLICSLIHKFAHSSDEVEEVDDEQLDDFISSLSAHGRSMEKAKGNIFVFVDEAHRTQSGKLHRAMKSLLPDSFFIGFTGTPLLRAEKASSIEAFGSFIHTYKFDEAVRDGVVLDLRYEARNIGQSLSGKDRIDEWFAAKTRGMTDIARAELKKRWGTMQKIVSSEPRSRRIVHDILLDFETKPRLMDGRGNAMLVAESVYQACSFYELFVQAGFGGKVAIVTSYRPNILALSKEDSGDGLNEELRKFEIYRQMLSDFFGNDTDEAESRVQEFELEVKRRFIKEPGQMKLLIVVDKLLTGFDAPSATYLYIDKQMKDHGLFQAICRVNRLDGDDKTYGYVVDYRDLFKSLQTAMNDFTSGALDGYERQDVEGLLTDRLSQAKEDLLDALEATRQICEGVMPPKGTLEYQHYFCADAPGDFEQLSTNEQKRVGLYKSVSRLTRSFGAIANELSEAGLNEGEILSVKSEVAHYIAVRDEVRLGAGENIDLKQFEPGMRMLLDTYIQADESTQIALLDKSLVELIVDLGADALNVLPRRVRENDSAAAEVIINNVRRCIVDNYGMNPKYFEKMSDLLNALIAKKNRQSEDYAAYLRQLLDLAARVGASDFEGTYPKWATTVGKKAVFDFAESLKLDPQQLLTSIESSREHGWKSSRIKERALSMRLLDDFENIGLAQHIDDLINLLRVHDEFN